MRLARFKTFCCLVFIFNIISCTSTKRITAPTQVEPAKIKFLGEYAVPFGLSFKSTTVGGLSGIDYDSQHDCYYLVCDDRSAINPARFYTAKISFTQKGIDTVYFTDVKNLLQANGNIYPNSKEDPQNTPDPEAIRYDASKKRLVWSSEGERIVRGKDTVLSDPSITAIEPDGKFSGNFTIPGNLEMKSVEKGPRQNGVFEGMSFADDFKTLFVSVEEPLYEDGPRADISDNNAFIRILKFDTETKTNIAQYAYKLDPVAYPSNPATAFKINGVPDILSIANNKLLVIERSFSSGRFACTIKLFLADLSTANDISSTSSLQSNNNFKPATKKLILNMDDLGIYIDNVEGMTFGPLLPNGHKTLLFVADNNFNPLEKSQFLLFEVIE